MINAEFYSIYDFVNHKRNCHFCNKKLNPKLSNFALHYFPANFSSKIIDDKLIFKFKYTSYSIDINVSGYLDIYSNDIKIDKNELNSNYVDIVDLLLITKPNITLYCSNRKCKSNYAVISNFLSVNDFTDIAKIKPFSVYLEQCSVNNYIVQSDLIFNCTRIIPKRNLKSDTIIDSNYINIGNFTLDKLNNRISTITTFH